MDAFRPASPPARPAGGRRALCWALSALLVAPALAAEVPPDVEPQLGRIEMAPLKPRLSLSAQVGDRKPRPKAAWALSTRPLKTRLESQRVLAAMSAALPGLRVEEMQRQNEWLVIGWPFDSRDGAQKALIQLAGRGLRTEIVEF